MFEITEDNYLISFNTSLKDLGLEYDTIGKLCFQGHKGFEYTIFEIKEWLEKPFCNGTIHTISNAVYEMVIEIKESQQHNRRSGISVPKWTVSWHVAINVLPSGSKITCYGIERAIVTGQSKSFSNKERAENYFEAIKAQYAHYFMDEFPPVPQKYTKHFMVNDVLLPGYSIEVETNVLQEAS